MPHDIRLAGPWEFSDGTSTWATCRLPWGVPEQKNSYSLRRRFHRPSGLDAQLRVLILVETNWEIQQIELNSQVVKSIDSQSLKEDAHQNRWAFDVTQGLKEFNTIIISPEHDTAELLHQVTLRIEDREELP